MKGGTLSPTIRPFEAVSEPFIAFLDKDYVAVFKPAGMNSTPGGTGAESGRAGGSPDLVSWLSGEEPGLGRDFPEEIPDIRDEKETESQKALRRRLRTEKGLLSRLDRDTSGLVLFARTKEVFMTSLELQSTGRVKKFYRLVASPSNAELPGFKPQRVRPEGFLAEAGFRRPGTGQSFEIEGFFRSFGHKGSRVACVAKDQASETRKKLTPKVYGTRVLSFGEFAGPEDSLGRFSASVEAMIRTGFRHQIRAHMAWIGFPVAGDSLYGGHPASRLYLESHRIEVELPGKEAIAVDVYDGSRGEDSWI